MKRQGDWAGYTYCIVLRGRCVGALSARAKGFPKQLYAKKEERTVQFTSLYLANFAQQKRRAKSRVAMHHLGGRGGWVGGSGLALEIRTTVSDGQSRSTQPKKK